MPRIVLTGNTASGMEKCRLFLSSKNSLASVRASHAIRHQFELLAVEPGIGRPLDDRFDLRELVIPFGDSGYVALYRHVPESDIVYILAFRHQKEAGY